MATKNEVVAAVNESGYRLIKKVAIAHSGLYDYDRSELPQLSLRDIPAIYADRKSFMVYRPACVMERCAPLFVCLPITIQHPTNNLVTPDKAKMLQEGLTGDTVTTEYKDGEVYIMSSLTLTTDRAMNIYDSGFREVSPGYFPVCKWLDEPKMYKGVEYQIILTDITAANHLALVPKGRGGTTACIVDHEKGEQRMFTGLIRFVKKLKGGAQDSVSVRAKLEGLTSSNAADTIKEVKGMIGDLPDTDGKKKLNHFLDDLTLCGDMAPDAIKEAVGITVKLFERLDKEAFDELKAYVGDSAAEPPKVIPSVDKDKEPVADKDKEEEKEEEEDKEKKEKKDKKPAADMAPGATVTAGAGSQAMKPVAGDAASVLNDMYTLLKAHFEGVAAQPVAVVDHATVGKPTASVSTSSSEGSIDSYMKEFIGGK